MYVFFKKYIIKQIGKSILYFSETLFLIRIKKFEIKKLKIK